MVCTRTPLVTSSNLFAKILCQCLFICCLLLSELSVKAQDFPMMENAPTLNVLGAEDFLGRYANFRSYDIECDEDGYVYFVTGPLVKKFNGTSIYDLSQPHEGALMNHTSICKDYFGKLWLFGSGGISTIEGDTVVPYKLPDSLAAKTSRGIESVYRDSTGTVHLALSGYGYYTVSSKGEVTEVLGVDCGLHGYGVTTLIDGSGFHFFIPQAEEKGLNMQVFYLHNDGSTKLIKQLGYQWSKFTSSLAEHGDGTFSISTGTNDIVRFKEDSLVSWVQFEHMIFNLVVDSRDDLWIGTVDHGFFRVQDNDFSNPEHYWRGGSGIMTEDKEGGLWAMSDSVSFAYIPPSMTYHYSGRNGYPYFDFVKYLLNTGTDVLCAAPPRGVYKLGETISYMEVPLKMHVEGNQRFDSYPLKMSFDSSSQTLWIAYVGEVVSWDGSEWKSYPLNRNVFDDLMIMDMGITKDGNVLGTTRRCVFELKEDSIVPLSENTPFGISHMAFNDEGTIWVTRDDGLWKLENGTFIRPLADMPLSLQKQCQFVVYTQGLLWVQPSHSSLLRIDDQGYETVLKRDGTPISLVNYSVAPNGDLWAGTNTTISGLCRIKRKGEATLIKNFVFDDQAIRMFYMPCFLVTRDQVFSGSAFGLFSAKLKDLKEDNREVKTVVNELRVNQEVVELADEYNLKYNENFINLVFDGVGYRRLSVLYRYRMEGLDSTWYESKHQQVQYTNLNPGEYKFTVQARAMNSNEKWGQSKSVSFVIGRPYWKTWWFWALVVLLLSTLVYVLFQYRLRQIREKEALKSKMAIEVSRLELRALKAQINPHFIFNAMSSVMYYLSQNRAEDAESYLQRFAELVRSVLENSERSAVPLEQEINLMRKYVSLESERFKGASIQFNIHSDGIELGKIWVPPTLLQPYIENSIWHGLRHKEGDRRIDLSCQREGGLLKVSIEDNGIGREASAKKGTSRREHKSFGMTIASRRIEVLNKEKVESVVIEDLVEENEPMGTRVTFYVPEVQQSNSNVLASAEHS